MDATLQADLQGVSDKDQAVFTVTIKAQPLPQPVDEVVDFTPAPLAA